MLVMKFRPVIRVFRNLPTIRGGGSVSSETLTSLNLLPAIEFRRSIFTDEFMNLDTFVKICSKVQLMTADREGFKKTTNSLFVNSGIHSIFTDDIIKLINLAESDEDFDLVKNILLEYMRDSIRLATAYKPLNFFFMLCLYLSKVNHARAVWNDEQVQMSGLLEPHGLRLIYFMILYRSESFDDLVNCYKNLKVTNLTEATLVMAALSKIGTSEAFTTATEIMRQPPIISNGTMKSSGGRVTAIYAHFALKLGQYGPAYDALTDPRRVARPSMFTTNLKILILTEVGRLKDALLIIRSEFLPARDALKEDGEKKPVVCLDVMMKLTNAVRDLKDAEMSNELTSLCKALDETAILTDDSIEKLIFRPMGPKVLSRRQRDNAANPHQHNRRQNKHERNFYSE